MASDKVDKQWQNKGIGGYSTGAILGTLTHYRGRFFVDYGSNPDGVLSWRFQRELAGHGTLGDLMSHVADILVKEWGNPSIQYSVFSIQKRGVQWWS